MRETLQGEMPLLLPQEVVTAQGAHGAPGVALPTPSGCSARRRISRPQSSCVLFSRNVPQATLD